MSSVVEVLFHLKETSLPSLTSNIVFRSWILSQSTNETIAIKSKVIEDQTDSIRKLKQVSVSHTLAAHWYNFVRQKTVYFYSSCCVRTPLTQTALNYPDCPFIEPSALSSSKILSSMFIERSTPGYVLRDSTNKLNVPLPRTNYLKWSFSYRGATFWNSLPCSLRQAKSLNHFKQLLNHHFS